ncbi:MAG: hypothetical protein ACPGSC_05600 [Granulosicoccaceae bacterium]
MSDIDPKLLDALIELPSVQSLWLRPNQRRGSHFSRADEDLLVCAPAIEETEWQLAMQLVERFERWHLISVFRVDKTPESPAVRVRATEC